MSRSVTIHRWCDGCAEEGQPDVEATASPLLTLNRVGPRTLDLCERHNAPVEALERLLTAYGVAPEVTTPARGAKASRASHVPSLERLVEGTRKGRPATNRNRQCLWCPLTYSPSGGLARHVGRHGFEETLAASYGTTCPLCGDSIAKGGVHLRRHEVNSLPEAFGKAILEGDPLGIVAARFAAADPATVRWTLEDYRSAVTSV